MFEYTISYTGNNIPTYSNSVVTPSSTFRIFDEVANIFIKEKRISIEKKSLYNYTGKSKVFSEWLKENNLSNIEDHVGITNDIIKDSFNSILMQ